MIIGVLSDTHIPFFAREIPHEIMDAFRSCDLIVHAGDILELSVIETLQQIAETKAVRGNMDTDEVKKALPESIVFEAGHKKVGVTHGRGPSNDGFGHGEKIFI